MISGINNVQNISPPQLSPLQSSSTDRTEPPTSFDEEDKAIISSQAKLQYELEKFNSGEGNDVNLAVAGVIAKTTVSAEVNVINAKKEMFDTVLDIGK